MSSKGYAEGRGRGHYGLWLFLVLSLAITLRFASIAQRTTVSHDDSISYLAAACHQGEYSERTASLQGQWLPASMWKSLLSIERPFCFQQISADLARNDIHPPLYFWLLHMWVLIFGVHIWTGSTLNVALFVISALLLYGYALHVTGNGTIGVVTVAFWSLSPATISTTLDARQYELLALCAIAFAWQIVLCTERGHLCSLRSWLLLVATSCIGLLTHYHFGFIIVGGFFFLGVNLGLAGWRRVFAVGAALFGGGIVFLLLHPDFWNSLLLQRQAVRTTFSVYELGARMNNVWNSYLYFLVGGSRMVSSKIVLVVIGASVTVWASIALWRDRNSVQDWLHRFRNMATLKGTVFSPLYFFLIWNSAIVVLSYLTFFSPAHAMGSPRYLAAVWPFMALILSATLLKSLAAYGAVTKWGFLVILLTALIFTVPTIWDSAELSMGTVARMATADRVVIDNVRRGNLLRVAWNIPDTTLVYAASQGELLEQQNRWLSKLTEHSLVVSVDTYDGQDKQHEIAVLLEEKFGEYVVRQGSWGVDTTLLLPRHE